MSRAVRTELRPPCRSAGDGPSRYTTPSGRRSLENTEVSRNTICEGINATLGGRTSVVELWEAIEKKRGKRMAPFLYKG